MDPYVATSGCRAICLFLASSWLHKILSILFAILRPTLIAPINAFVVKSLNENVSYFSRALGLKAVP